MARWPWIRRRASRQAHRFGIRKFGDAGNEVALTFTPSGDISERVIFPITQTHWHGIEDARFVEFNDDGKRIFYATYTAYSGDAIRSELLETTDFVNFRLIAPQRDRRAKQGHGLVPAQDQRQVRHDRAARQ